ncbi:MAG: hypothetical protein KAX84_18755, partial [Burkholderiales bacterium]|nr:hypothetical protein [Burkholderiales bacterium]
MQRRPAFGDPVHAVFGAVAAAVLFLITMPLIITVFTAFNATSQTVFPPNGWSLRWFSNIFRQREFIDAFWLSTALAFASGTLAMLLGTLGAIVL